MNIGDQLYKVVFESRSKLFLNGEMVQLTWGAFDIAANSLRSSTEDEVTITYPLGLLPDKTPIQGKWTYKKEQLLEKYTFLAVHQLAVNGLYQLVATVEAMFGDVVRSLVLKYPQKLGSKRTIPLCEVLEASSIEEMHLRAADALLNDLSYKSPKEFAEAVEAIISFNILECPSYHRYMEVKASRDIFVHNMGVANEIYLRKASTHARCKTGAVLPADPQYFLESYETCIQLTEWLEEQLHARWHSNEREERQNQQKSKPDGNNSSDA